MKFLCFLNPMKYSLLVLFLAGLLGYALPGNAQEGGGNPIKLTSTLHGDGTRTDTQKDIDNHTAETRTYDVSKKLVQRCVYTLNDEGKEVEGVMYNAKGAIVSRSSFKYDIMGRVSEQINKAPDGTLLGRMVISYDATGRPTMTAYDAQGNLLKGDGTPAAPLRKKSSRNGSR